MTPTERDTPAAKTVPWRGRALVLREIRPADESVFRGKTGELRYA